MSGTGEPEFSSRPRSFAETPNELENGRLAAGALSGKRIHVLARRSVNGSAANGCVR